MEHVWVQASSHQGGAHIIYISLKPAVRHWFLSKPGVSMMQAPGWGARETCHPSGAVRSCQRTGSRALARRGQASQLSPLRHWLRPSIWLREAHHGWRGSRQIPRLHDGRNSLTHTSRHVSCAHWHTNTCLCTYNDILALLYACTHVRARTMLVARAISGNHQHNLRCCPHESFFHRPIRETEVTCCHRAEQTQIKNYNIWL